MVHVLFGPEVRLMLEENNDAGMKVDNALDGLKAIADGKEIKYSGASGPCKFSDTGNIIEVAFRTAQVKDGKLVAVQV